MTEPGMYASESPRKTRLMATLPQVAALSRRGGTGWFRIVRRVTHAMMG